MIERIGKYRILELLGQGGMGKVYRAEDSVLGRTVAIKVLASSPDEESLERFLLEARIVGRLSHPNIVVLHDFGYEDDRPYLVMEYLEGESLKTWMGRGPSLAALLPLMTEVADALAYAHDRDVLHRDIKPANVQVLPTGHCKLMDFGIARGGDVHLTASGVVLGTPAYIAPEVYAGGGYTKRSDLYALCVLFYEMLSGANPFMAESIEASIFRVLHHDPPSLVEVRPDVDEALARLIDRGLSKRPGERPESVRDLLGCLRGSTVAAGDEALPVAGVTESMVGVPVGGGADGEDRGVADGGRSSTVKFALIAGGAVVLAGLLVSVQRMGVVDNVSSRGAGASRPLVGTRSPVTVAAPTSTPAGRVGRTAGLAIRRLTPAGVTPAPEQFPAAGGPSPRRPTSSGAGGRGGPPRESTVAADGGAGRSRGRPVPPFTSPVPTFTATLPPSPTATSAPTATPTRRPSPTPTFSDQPPSRTPALPPVRLTSVRPRTIRRGETVRLDLQGENFTPDLSVHLLRSGRPAAAITLLRSRRLDDRRWELVLRPRRDSPLGTYQLILRSADGRTTNPLLLEVEL